MTPTTEFQLPEEYQNISVPISISFERLVLFIQQNYSDEFPIFIEDPEALELLKNLFVEKSSELMSFLIFDTLNDDSGLYPYLKRESIPLLDKISNLSDPRRHSCDLCKPPTDESIRKNILETGIITEYKLTLQAFKNRISNLTYKMALVKDITDDDILYLAVKARKNSIKQNFLLINIKSSRKTLIF